MIGRCHSAAPLGVSARLVEVEVDVRGGRPGMVFVGLPDTAVREAQERVRSALLSRGYEVPGETRITVNLAPAVLRKEGSAYDLPIAVALLVATGQLQAPGLGRLLLLGELALDGRVRPIRGALCVADRAARGRWRGLLVPVANATEAALAGGPPIHPVATLDEAVLHLAGARSLPAAPRPDLPPQFDTRGPDFADVRGQEGAVRAALLAAAGGHNLLLVGPPGSGKTMIAERLPGILPPLDTRECIEATKIHSVAGLLRDDVVAAPPFRAPHHTVSPAGLLGGGARVSPGEITLAHCGVLFLDELPEFERRALEGLREPLERGAVVIARAAYRVRFPSRVLLVAAMNPCPCGNHGVPRRDCDCTPRLVERYRARISGPLLDRFDLQVRVGAVDPTALGRDIPPGPSSAALRERVAAARAVQAERGCLNAALAGRTLEAAVPLDAAAETYLARAAERLQLSARAHVRVRRLARTIADLAGDGAVGRSHLAEAVSFRLRGEG